MKNTGKASEKEWEEVMEAKYGKLLNLHDLLDTSNIKKENLKSFVNPAPADYVVTANHEMFYAEIKSCSSKTSFGFSQFTPSQNACMLKQTNAGGQYWVYIHRLETDEWYRVPASLILKTKHNNIKSLKWKDLSAYSWGTKQ